MVATMTNGTLANGKGLNGKGLKGVNVAKREALRQLIEDVLTNDVELNVTVDDDEIARITEKVLQAVPVAAQPAQQTAPAVQEVEIDADAIVADVLGKIDVGAIADSVAARIKPIVKHIEIKAPSGKTVKITDRVHPAFERAVRLASRRKNIMLIGPAGSGKTHMAAQLAKALDLPFAHITCSAGMSEGQLLGRLLPTGKNGTFEYCRSEFVRAYEEGGVFLFDEIDAADSNTLLVLNSALANGHLSVPNRVNNPIAKRHPDFVCVAAANTYGTGADRQYVGRNQLDGSTLDRFRVGQIEMDYDADVEAALCPDDALRARLQGYRAACRKNRLRRLVSMRFLADAYEMKQAGDSDAEIDAALFAGWTEDESRKVRGVA